MRWNPVYYLARVMGTAWVPRIAVLGVVLLLLMGGGMAAAFVASNSGNWVGSEDPSRVQVAEAAIDSDEDGLPDALENRIGSDPDNPTTLGGGVLDGWLFQWFGESVDWTDPGLLESRVLVAPTEMLPPPLRAPGKIEYPSVQELYRLDHAWRDPENETRLWWFESLRLDPLQWDNKGDGVADAWLVQYGLDPLDVKVEEPAPGDPMMSIREKYEAGLNPLLKDSAGNGLPDIAEITGVVRFKEQEVRFDPTDPTRFSSRGDGISDGFIVRFGLDPHDERVGESKPAGDGVSVREAYQATRAHCVAEVGDGESVHTRDPRAGEEGVQCDWLRRLQEGPLVDPTAWDSLGDGIPDAWSLRDPEGVAHPLLNATTVEVYSTSQWDENPWDGDPENLFGVVVDELNPQPEEPFVLTLHDLYMYQRPASWNEETMGPWWGGLPTRMDPVEGALPPAVALRGWTVQIDTELGRPPDRDPDSHHLVLISVSADPRKGDTDGDGLTDLEEYFGVARREVHGFRTNPSDPDTSGSGLTDCQEILHLDRIECEDPGFPGPFVRGCTADGSFCLDPLRRDTSGSFLTDGYEYAYWTNRAEAARTSGGDPLGLAPDVLGPLGDVDGDGVPNILDRDSDGDSLPDGMELYPTLYLPQAGGLPRPATDPAMKDTDGDDLPDPWEIQWSHEHHHDCSPPCRLPDETELRSGGWPLDPSHRISLLSDRVELGDDRDMNYAGDHVTIWSQVGERGSRDFDNWLAYVYGLNPYDRFTDPSDGIPDMFAIHWGVEQVPEWVEGIVEADREEFGWTKSLGGDLAAQIAERNLMTDTDIELDQEHVDNLVVMNPAQVNGQISKDTNLLGYFIGRAKGTWVIVEVAGDEQEVSAQCDGSGDHSLSLPTTGPRREQGVPLDPGVGGVVFPDRTGESFELDPLGGFCWQWIDYPLGVDIARGTNPWRHDSSGNGLPDAWEWYYLGANRTSAEAVLDSSVKSGCRDVAIEGVGDPCLAYGDAYRHGLNPLVADTDGGGLPDWFELALDPPLNPLDPFDDRGEEDWSGNGLPNVVELALGLNPFSPDTSGSGLLDGGDLSPGSLGAERLEGLQEEFLEKGLVLFPFFDSTQGNGDLCLRRGGDEVPNMENRPNIGHPVSREGSLTRSELFDWYVDLGIVHDRDPGGVCPGPEVDGTDGKSYPFVLFFRESVRPPQAERGWTGAGTGPGGLSDSLQRDTSGDGVPDGWLVYWGERAPQFSSAFSPATHTGFEPGKSANVWDPDGDFMATPVEYGGPNVDLANTQGSPTWFAPEDWDEARDGTWWGGTDPTRRWTTLTPTEWFVEPLTDRTYFDFDNDGIPDRYDPYPGIDHYNEGIIEWVEDCPRMGYDGQGCYVTDYTRLWDALEDRRVSQLWDDDGDRVPKFLDRVRVRIDLDEVSLSDPETGQDLVRLQKGGDHVVVAGTVRVDEPEPEGVDGYEDFTLLDERGIAPVGDGAAVGNVSVKAFLRDVDGNEALVGAGFTDLDGVFRIDLGVSDSVPVGSCPGQGGSVGGHLCAGPQEPPTLVSDALRLQPGPLSIRFEVEANDPARQPLWFNGDGAASSYAVAYKAASEGAPFFVPDGTGAGRGYQASHVALNADGTARSSTVSEVMHVANATFPHSSASINHFLLLAETELRFSKELPWELLLGEDLEVGGVFLDAAQEVPLSGGYNVTVQVARAGEVLGSGRVMTDSEGVFHVVFPTGGVDGISAGPVTVTAEVELTKEQAEVLQAPDEVIESTVAIRQDTRWVETRINGEAVDRGTTFEHSANDELVLEARLIDHQEPPFEVVGLVSQWRIVGLLVAEGEEFLVASGAVNTDGGGRVSIDVGAIPERSPLGEFRLELVAGTTSGSDSPQHYEVLLRPIHQTQVVGLSDTRVDAGRAAVLEGQVLRADDEPVFDPEGRILARSGGMVVEGTSLNATGHFRVQVSESVAKHSVWNVEFVPGHGQLHGSSAGANTTHATPVRFTVDEVRGLRDEQVLVSGQLVRPDGAGIKSGVVSVAWADSDGEEDSVVRVHTAGSGRFMALLPGRGVGEHEVVLEFAGLLTAYPASQQVPARVLEPTDLRLRAEGVTFWDDGTADRNAFVTGKLVDGDGNPLGSRTVTIRVEGSDGRNVSVRATTDPESGAFGVGLEHVGVIAPGEWRAAARYEGAPLEAPSGAEAGSVAVHEVSLILTRIPGEIRAGSEFVVRGTLGSTLQGEIRPIPIDLLLDGARVADAMALAGEPWQARVTMPAGPPGEMELSVDGHPDQKFVRVLGDQKRLVRVHGVAVSIDEEVSGAGDRRLDLRAVDTASETPVGGLTLVLVRSMNGSVMETYEVTLDSRGKAPLFLAAGDRGQVELVAVMHDSYRLDLQDHQVFNAPAPAGGADWKVYVLVLAGSVAMILGGAFVAWRRRQRRTLAAAFEEAHRLLIDPLASAAQVIEEVYGKLLLVLEEAGEEIRDEHTVRDISQRATRAFALPKGPMEELTMLIELAKYSTKELGVQDRDRAIQTLRTLVKELDASIEIESPRPASGGVHA